jgi:hypothetical protein
LYTALKKEKACLMVLSTGTSSLWLELVAETVMGNVSRRGTTQALLFI